jgi:hypothetical protein
MKAFSLSWNCLKFLSAHNGHRAACALVLNADDGDHTTCALPDCLPHPKTCLRRRGLQSLTLIQHTPEALPGENFEGTVAHNIAV